MSAGRFVLENQNGEVTRTFGVDAETLYIVYRHDTRRIDVVGNLDDLKRDDVSYELLKKIAASSAQKRATPLANGATFRFAKEIDRVVGLVDVGDDSRDEENKIYKYTAFTQLGAMLFIMVVGLLIEPLFVKQPVETVVTVIPQQFIPPKVEKVTVQATEKVKPVQKVANKKVESHVKKVSKILTQNVRSARKENATLRTKVKVENVGALGALGGMKTGSKNSAGFNMNALNDSKGTSYNGAGSGGVGGMERAIHGKGLVASAMGRGGQVQGGGGYGTRGKAGGGRPGYGQMGMGGTAAAYFEPVQEEALVEGGLSKDQIAAVINRHIGEVIYCYEKGLQVKSGLSGRVGVKFTIAGNGIVSAANVASSSINSAQVEGCVVKALRGWQFPKPVGGVNVKVQYPFVLKRLSHG